MLTHSPSLNQTITMQVEYFHCSMIQIFLTEVVHAIQFGNQRPNISELFCCGFLVASRNRIWTFRSWNRILPNMVKTVSMFRQKLPDMRNLPRERSTMPTGILVFLFWFVHFFFFTNFKVTNIFYMMKVNWIYFCNNITYFGDMSIAIYFTCWQRVYTPQQIVCINGQYKLYPSQ